MISEDTILKLIRFASMAPSGHNTQPWFFEYAGNTITIHPDFDRSLPVVDSDNHALYISLGCALENLLIAATQYGILTDVRIVREDGNSCIEIDLVESSNQKNTDLFIYIPTRQVTKRSYIPAEPDKKIIQSLKESVAEDGISARFFTQRNEIDSLLPYIIEGSNLQFKNKKFVRELVSWIRFNEKKAMELGDGIWSESMGMPNLSTWLGKIIMTRIVSASSEAKRWKKLVANTAGFVLFMVEENNVEHWIKLGQAFQRFGLTATRFNVCHAHVNMPCEELEVRNKLIADFQLTQIPLLLIRFGNAEPMPYSFRRKLDTMVIKS